MDLLKPSCVFSIGFNRLFKLYKPSFGWVESFQYMLIHENVFLVLGRKPQVEEASHVAEFMAYVINAFLRKVLSQGDFFSLWLSEKHANFRKPGK